MGLSEKVRQYRADYQNEIDQGCDPDSFGSKEAIEDGSADDYE